MLAQGVVSHETQSQDSVYGAIGKGPPSMKGGSKLRPPVNKVGERNLEDEELTPQGVQPAGIADADLDTGDIRKGLCETMTESVDTRVKVPRELFWPGAMR